MNYNPAVACDVKSKEPSGSECRLVPGRQKAAAPEGLPYGIGGLFCTSCPSDFSLNAYTSPEVLSDRF